jgi:hypothetical protein
VADDDILKNAGRFFSQLGSSVKKSAQKVTGIGRGTVQVGIDRARYAPGDDIHGAVTLTLPEGVYAKRLIVTVRATQRAVDYQRNNGVRTIGSSSATVYEFTHELGGEKTYESGSHAFTLPLPKDLGMQRPSPPDSTLGDVARVVSSVVRPITGPVAWRITASLVISMGRDLDHGVDIVVG